MKPEVSTRNANSETRFRSGESCGEDGIRRLSLADGCGRLHEVAQAGVAGSGKEQERL
jgi:hypothetical protein